MEGVVNRRPPLAAAAAAAAASAAAEATRARTQSPTPCYTTHTVGMRQKDIDKLALIELQRQESEALLVAQQEKENAARKEQASKIKAAKKRRAQFEAEAWKLRQLQLAAEAEAADARKAEVGGPWTLARSVVSTTHCSSTHAQDGDSVETYAPRARTRVHFGVGQHPEPTPPLSVVQAEFEALHKETAARKAEMERLAAMEEARVKRIAADAESEIKAQHAKSKAEKQAEELKRQAEADEVAKVSIQLKIY